MRELITEAEAKRIQECVERTEKRTASEILPAIVAASDDYPAAGWRAGAVFALLGTAAFAYFAPHLDLLWLLSAELAAFALGVALVSFVPELRRLFLRDYKTAEEVHQRALQAFFELGVHRTRARTGVLIFVSLLEHRAEILCDIGIAEKVGQESWKRLVDELAQGVKNGALVDSICGAIEAAGDLVVTHFPPSPSDINELSNQAYLGKK